MFRRLLFIHDHRFIVHEGGVYSEGKLGYRVFSRYAAISAKVLVLARKRYSESVDVGSLEKSSGERIDFQFLLGEGWKASLSRYFFRNLRSIYKSVALSDAVILRVPSVLSILTMPLVFMRGRPYFVEVVGDPRSATYSALGGGVRGAIVSSFMAVATAWIVRHSRATIYVTSDFLQSKYPSYGHCSFASNVEVLMPAKDVLEKRLKRLERKNFEQTLVLGIIASYSNDYKGVDVLIRALVIMQDPLPGLRLKVVGSGNSAPLLDLADQLGLRGSIEFVGILSRGEILKFLDDIDLYCQPSRSEGLPRALVEAMSRGCPAVGTRVGGIPELLQEEVLVDSEDYKALAQVILDFSRSVDLRRSASIRNFEVAMGYDAEKLEARRSEFWAYVESNYS